MTLAAGIRLGPYEVLAQIGAGGMGEVYRARDTRLGREVAIKVLSAEFARDPDRLRRFEQEARAVAALNHPNILALYDVGTAPLSFRAGGEESCRAGSPDQAGGSPAVVPYLVTELLEGESLRDRLQGGAIPVRKAVDIGIQIAHGLAAAHEKGIVHRDLKPGNVFLTRDGHVKILDFGLAKLAPAQGGDEAGKATTVVEATEAGVVLGTVGYMSPEQVRGQTVDHRTDVFALGCVLYEVLAGEPAFGGGTTADTLSAILGQDPRPLSSSEREIPAALGCIVSQCLEKHPEERFSSAHDVALALRVLSGATEASRVQSPSAGRPTGRQRRWMLVGGAAALVAAAIVGWTLLRLDSSSRGRISPEGDIRLAVLPFENLGVADNAYFASGVTDEITGRLAGVRGLAVISRASALQYARTTKSTRQVGDELGVSYLVTGTVRWAGGTHPSERVRITPQLVRVSDDTSVWAKPYDFAMNDIFRVQSEIARSVVERLGVTLIEHERGSLEARTTDNLEAYQAYLRGRFLAGKPHFTLSTWLEALAEFRHATELDPGFAVAWAELSRAHARLVYYRYDISPSRRAEALRALEHARLLAGAASEVHLAAGYYHLWVERDPAAALVEFEATAARQPGDADVLAAEGELFRLRGDWRRALDAFRATYALNPRDASAAVDVAETLWWMRRYREADATADQSIRLDPGQAWTHLTKAFNLWSWKGLASLPQTREVLRQVPEQHEWAVWAWYWQDACEGRYEEALAGLDASPGDWIRVKLDAAPKVLFAALVHTWLGEPGRARAEMERAWRMLEAEIERVPEDDRYHSTLGVAYAALGRREEALREGRRGIDLLPISKDPIYGVQNVYLLAHIYELLGEDEQALAQLEDLLSRPTWISAPFLEMDPRWTTLRGNPRFQALLKKYAVTE